MNAPGHEYLGGLIDGVPAQQSDLVGIEGRSGTCGRLLSVNSQAHQRQAKRQQHSLGDRKHVHNVLQNRARSSAWQPVWRASLTQKMLVFKVQKLASSRAKSGARRGQRHWPE